MGAGSELSLARPDKEVVLIPWINLELTNRCHEDCYFCGRNRDRKNNTLELGDMDIKLAQKLIDEFDGYVMQFNRDGDCLLYPHLWQVGYLTRQKGIITNIVTKGRLLWELRDVMEEFSTLCISVIEDDAEQFEIVRKFHEKYDMPITIKFLGDYYNPGYAALGLKTTSRQIHHPDKDSGYKKQPTIPELGICLDFLLKPSVSWKGDFHICNRYDPEGKGCIGDCNTQTLKEIWNSERRKQMLWYHVQGNRDKLPLCEGCKFWGIPAV